VGRPKVGRCCSLKLSGKHARSVLVVIHPERGNHKKGAVALEEAEAGGEAGVEVVAVVVMQEARIMAEKRDKSRIQCFKYHMYGHYANRCLEQKKDGEEAQAHLVQAQAKQALMLAITEEPESLELMPQVTTGAQHHAVFLDERKVVPELHLTCGMETVSDRWFLDNGASNHMTRDAEMFKMLDETVTRKVRFGDGSAVEIKGEGTILFKCKNGDQ
jgi:ABC-type cobalamin/Fe3+-siderophores transport system ATPase subunit